MERNKISHIQKILSQKSGQKTVIYVLTINDGRDLTDSLKKHGYNVELYHSKIPEDEKIRIQNEFSGLYQPELNILVSTSAFGMGVDIKHIRCVIHYSIPSNIEDYYQQMGRVGRDGKKAEAILIYQKGDEELNKFILSKAQQKVLKSEEEINKVRQVEEEELQTMLGYVISDNKWKFIIDYFGEKPIVKEYWYNIAILLIVILLLYILLMSI